jgi:hypothetical protein
LRKGHVGEERVRHSQYEDADADDDGDGDDDDDNGVAVLFLVVYAVYDEGFEEDGAVL